MAILGEGGILDNIFTTQAEFDEAQRAGALRQQEALFDLQQQAESQRLGQQSGNLAAGVTALGQPEAFSPLADPAARTGEIAGLLNQGGQVGQQAAAGVVAPLMPQTEAQRLALGTEQARQGLIAQQIEQSRSAVALNQARLGQIDQQLQGASVERRQTLSNQVRDDFSSAMSDTAETLLAYEQTDRLITGGTALEAQIAITKLAKLSDPGSTVRVEEGRMVASGTGLAERIATEYNKMAGDGFSEGARIQFRNAMRDLSEPTALAGQRIIQDYAGLAARWNLNLDDIIAGTGINPELLGKLAVGQEQFNRRNQVEFSDLMAPTNTGVIQRAP